MRARKTVSGSPSPAEGAPAGAAAASTGNVEDSSNDDSGRSGAPTPVDGQSSAGDWNGSGSTSAATAGAGAAAASTIGSLASAAAAANDDYDDESLPEMIGKHTQRKEARGQIAPAHLVQHDDVTVVWNLSNEPRLKFAMPCVADRGFSESQWTSARLQSEVLYLESDSQRWELAREASDVASGKSGDFGTARFRWARVKSPSELDAAKLDSLSPLPLAGSMVEVLEAGMTWEELEWAEGSVWLRGTEYPIRCIEWRPLAA